MEKLLNREAQNILLLTQIILLELDPRGQQTDPLHLRLNPLHHPDYLDLQWRLLAEPYFYARTDPE